MSRRRRRRLATTLGVLVLLVVGGVWLGVHRSEDKPRAKPKPSASPSGARAGGVLRLLSENRFASLDPAALTAPRERNLGRLLYRTLITYGSDGRSLTPDLADGAGVPSSGGRAWTYRLKPDQHYADGSSILASDVVRGIRRSLARNALPPGLVASVAAPDPATVVVRFLKPFVDADSVVALTAAAPVPPRGVVASGPYQLASLSGASFRLTRNPHWDGSVTGPDEVVAELGLDGATIDQRLQASAGGDAFAVTDKPVLDIVPTAKKRLVRGLDGSVLFAALDMHRGPFADIKVRQALQVAFPVAQVRAAAGGDAVGEDATDLLPPSFEGHQTLDVYGGKARHFEGDPSRAKQMLSDVGLSSGVAVTVAVPRSAVAVGEVLKAQLAPAGFRVTVTAVPDASYYATVGTAATQADLVLFAWSPDWLTPSAVIPPLFTCSALTPTANRNPAQHCDRGFDQQVDRALATTDEDARVAMWEALDRRLVEEALIVPRSFGVARSLVGTGVHGAGPALAFGGMVDLRRLTLR